MNKVYGSPVDFSTVITEMNERDRMLFYQFASAQVKAFNYGDFRSYTVSATKDNTGVNALIRMKTNKEVQFGSGGETKLSYNGTNFNFNTTSAVQKAVLSMNGFPFLELNAADSCVAMKKTMNYTGTAPTRGISFHPTQNNLQIIGWPMELLSAGMATGNYTINKEGDPTRGLKFIGSSGTGTFLQDLIVTGEMKSNTIFVYSSSWFGGITEFDQNLKIPGHTISYDGSTNGLQFLTSPLRVDCKVPLTASSTLTTTGLFRANGDILLPVGSLMSGNAGAGTGITFLSDNGLLAYQHIDTNGYVLANSYIRSLSYIESNTFVKTDYYQLLQGGEIPATSGTHAQIHCVGGTKEIFIKWTDGTRSKFSTSTVP